MMTKSNSPLRAFALAALAAAALLPADVDAKVFISQRTVTSDNSRPHQDQAFYLGSSQMMIQTFEGLNFDPTNRWYPVQGGKAIPMPGGSRDYIYEGERYVYSVLDWNRGEISKQPLQMQIPRKVSFYKIVSDKETFKKVYEKLNATSNYEKLENSNGIFWCQKFEGTLDGTRTEVLVTRGVVESGKKGWSNHIVYEPAKSGAQARRYPSAHKIFVRGAMVEGYPIRVIRYEGKNRTTTTLTQQVSYSAGFDDASLVLPKGFRTQTLDNVSDFLKLRPGLPKEFSGKFPWPY